MIRTKLYATAAVVGAVGLLSASTPGDAAVINDLFAFGDSYTDIGSLIVQTNGSPSVAYMAQDFGITLTTSHNPDPGTDGVDFAEAGARIDAPPRAPATQPRSLTQQVGLFQDYVENNEVTFNPSTTLFFLAGGLNDHNRTPGATLAQDTASQIATLYALGGRIFEIAILPQDIPGFVDSADNINPANEALLPELKAEYPDAVFALSNWGPDYDQIITNPTDYGLTNNTTPCHMSNTNICSTPDSYFFYLPNHPSDFVHHIVGDELYQEALALPTPVPEASTWAMMVSGFLGLGFASYRITKKKALAA
jgi:phospholipase/lecithinase/hemolysin